jgi:hypothetical protein
MVSPKRPNGIRQPLPTWRHSLPKNKFPGVSSATAQIPEFSSEYKSLLIGRFGAKVALCQADREGSSSSDQPRRWFRRLLFAGGIMSVASIFSSAFASSAAQLSHRPSPQFQQEFQQLGQDLQAGNLSAAQIDFATLQQSSGQTASSANTNNPIAQAFQQLSQDLQSGNLSAAQQAFSQIQQDFQNGSVHAHHHHHSGGENQSNSINQLFQQLGQQLQSGNLSAAQQAYSALSQDLQLFSPGSTASATQSPVAASGLSVTA